MIKKVSILFVGIFYFLLSIGYAEKIKLYMPIIADSPKQHLYFHDLLKTSIQESGQDIELITKKMPQSRIVILLQHGALSIYWMVESEARNTEYIPIEVGITNGLIGKRVLFIKKGDQHIYDKVKNIDDFRNLKLIGGMGENWFDLKVWKANGLLYNEQKGNWNVIFKMVSVGWRYHYFPRGVNEILSESKEYPYLEIEKNLLFIYDRDFRFYLSKTGKHAGKQYKNVIENALKKAKASGLIEKLVRKYWNKDITELNYDKRIKIHLKTPK